MKGKIKFLSIIMAFAMVFGSLSIPTIAKGISSADEGAGTLSPTTSNVLQIQKPTGGVYKVGQSFDFRANIGGGSGVDFQLWAPNGEVLVAFGSSDISYEFKTPGLYAYQYKNVDTSDQVVFSEQFFIPVEGADGSTIVLSETISSVAKTGSVVTVPKTITEGVTIKVYSPYGKLVKTITDTDRTFSNLASVKGTYYIEYSKNDGAIVKYLTVDFGDNYAENTSEEVDDLYIFEYSDDLEEISKDGYIYMFRDYSLSATAYDLTGKELAKSVDSDTAEGGIEEGGVVSPASTTTNPYKVLIKIGDSDTEGNDSSIRLDNFSDAGITSLAKEGLVTYKIKIELKKDSEVIFSKTIEAKAKFNTGCISIKLEKIVADFITLKDLNLAYPVEPTGEGAETPVDTNWYNFPKAEIVWADGYSASGDMEDTDISKLDANVSLTLKYTDDSSITLGGDNDTLLNLNYNEETLIYGIKLIKDKYKEDENGLDYSTTVDTTKRTISLEYSFKLSVEKEGINTNHTWTKTATTKIVESKDDFADNVAPVFGSFEDYEIAIPSGEYNFVIPAVSVTDNLNSGSASNGVEITVRYTNLDNTDLGHDGKVGESVTLREGMNKIVYTAKDSSGNTATKTIYVRVVRPSDIPNVEYNPFFNATVEKQDNEITFNFTAGGTGNVSDMSYAVDAVLYVDGEVATTPKKIVYKGDFIKSITIDDPEKNFVIVLTIYYKVNDKEPLTCRYMSVGIDGRTEIQEALPYSYNYRENSSTYQASFYAETSCYVGDSVVWPYGDEVTIEADCKYTFINDCLTPQTAGTIKIISNKTNQYAIITAKVGSVSSPTLYTASNRVVEVKNEAGALGSKEVEIQLPYIPNYFGYKLTTSVASTKGDNVVLNGNTLTVSSVDKFVVTHTFSYEGITKTVSETISSGNIEAPVINIKKPYETTIWNGESARIDIISASAIDKFGKTLQIGQDGIVVKDSSGKIIETQKDGDNLFVTVTSAGIYSVSYTVTDSDGISAIETVNFLVVFPEEAEKGMSAWAIVGIVLGSLAGASLVAFLVYLYIKNNKKQKRFINKNRQAKKTEGAGIVLFTISENKDSSVWTVKCDGRVISKEKSKEDALAKIESKRSTNVKIKVYNSTGRLIDSIEK